MDERLAGLEWLSPLTPRERHKAVHTGRVDGVGDWLLRTPEFIKWRKGEGGPAGQVLFCYGAPGVGKTCLSSLVIDTLSDRIDGEKDAAVAYMYCDFNAESEESATTVLGALLKQVVGGLSRVPEEVRKDLESAKSQVDGRGLQLPEILSLLTKSLSFFPRGFLCIDALDEFPEKHRPQLWESLKHIVRECPKTRFFLTGRSHIQDEVQKYFPGAVDVIPISPTKEDIEIYVKMRLKKDSETDEMDEELREDILRIIPEKMSEIFFLVSLAMDAILAGVTTPRRKQILYRVADGLGLEYGYSLTLARIRDQGGNKSKLGMDALMWVCRSQRPLDADELRHALGVEVRGEDFNIHNVPSIRAILGSTLGLVTIDEKSSTVRPIHFTLQEYFGEQPTLFATAHSRIAEVCLTYLNSRYIRELSPTLNIAPSTAPFLEYAACFWDTHATMHDVTESVKARALQLLDGYENHVSANILLRKKRLYYGVQGHVEGFTGLHCTAFLGITEIARSMVATRRWDLNGRDSNGSTPLLWAATYGNEEVVELLLEQRGTNPNMADGAGRTPLSLAAELGLEDIVRLLLKRGDVNPDLPDSAGRTPLSFAAEWGREDVVRRLLERADVNPSSTDNAGHTPLSLASGWRRQEAVVKLLRERLGNKPDPSDTGVQPPLPVPTMNAHGSTATQLRNPNQKLSKRNRGRISPSTPAGDAQAPFLRLERENVNPPTADNPSAAATLRTRRTPTTPPENRPVPPRSPPNNSRRRRWDFTLIISFGLPPSDTPVQAESRHLVPKVVRDAFAILWRLLVYIIAVAIILVIYHELVSPM